MVRRNWKKLVLLSALGIVIGTAQGFLLRWLYGIPSLQAFVLVAILLGICDILFAWNVERTTKAEGPGIWNSLVGRQGTVISTVSRDGGKAGTVKIAGEIWKARCRKAKTVTPGEKVRVTARGGLVLDVEPLDSDQERGKIS